jgi:hypothetical protein
MSEQAVIGANWEQEIKNDAVASTLPIKDLKTKVQLMDSQDNRS